MRIAIDADPIGRDGSGNETYLRGLISAMGHLTSFEESLILFGSRPQSLDALGIESASVVPCTPGLRGDLGLGRLMRRHHADVILAHYNLPIGRSCPAATIVHDVAFLRVPETFALAQRKRLQFSIRRSVSCSEAIVTSSEFSRDELLDCYPSLEKADVVVAPAAPSPSYFQRLSPEKLNEIRSRYLLPAEFVLCVGNVQPRKNLIRTAEAVARSQIPLVLVGQRHGRRLSMPDSARWLGYVPGGDLAALFQLCSVFCYVSRYEGFGLPVIEALASGAVVVTSSTSSLPEVAGEAALLADPHSVEAISAAIQRGLTDTQLRRELQAAGPLRAGQFTYDGSATRVLDRLRQIAT